MPVPLPPPDLVLPPPDHDEVIITARAVATAVAGSGELQDIQHYVLSAHFEAMTGLHVYIDTLEPMSAPDFAEAMRNRGEDFRIRMVQTMLMLAFIVTPLEDETVDRIAEYARELSINEGMIEIAHEIAHGAHGLVMADFSRAGYHAHLDTPIERTLHVHTELHEDWQEVNDDPVLEARWAALENLAPDTLGRQLWEFYRSRGFHFPGTPGSAPPLLSQHDWLHVIADYGSTVESEIEVFGLISRADDDPRAFSLLAMVLSLFETGMLHAATIFEFDPNHLSHDSRRMAIRLADAMRRGAIIGAHFDGHDLLTVDWFAWADKPLDEVRAIIGIPPKSDLAIASGAVGPWELGGISPFQLAAGQDAAEARGEVYDAHGAAVLIEASEDN